MPSTLMLLAGTDRNTEKVHSELSPGLEAMSLKAVSRGGFPGAVVGPPWFLHRDTRKSWEP